MSQDAYDMRGPSLTTGLYLRWFGALAHRNASKFPGLASKLRRARHPLVPEAYLATIYSHVVIGAIIGLVPLVAVVLAPGTVPGPLLLALMLLPLILAGVAYAIDIISLDLTISRRRQDLDQNIPYALNFMATLSGAGVVPVETFGALATQRVYGEAAREARWIYRDARVFGQDMVGAMKAGARRSPSKAWEEFLNGAVNTISSGGDLKKYLLAKSQHYAEDAHRSQKSFLESMGVMAESYVVVAAAAPLFLIVVLSVMLLMEEGRQPLVLLYMLVLGGLPVIHGLFAWILSTMKAA